MGREPWHNLDLSLLVATIALVAVGIAAGYSATINSSGLEELTYRQIAYAIIGFILMIILSFVDYRFLESIQKPLYAVLIVVLGVLLIIGQMRFGAQRWIDIRLFPIQPSEIAKIIIIVVLAKYLTDSFEVMGHLRHVIFSLLFIFPPILLIYFQPALGTSISIAIVWLGMIFAAGAKVWQLALLGLGGVAVLPFLWVVLHDYMRQRVFTFLNPLSDPLGAGYNVIQARVAIGSGGIWGAGFTQGSQSQLHFLRVRHTDFIFSVVGEEMGFIGSTLLFALIVFVLWRILRAAAISRDHFGYFIAYGVATIIFFQSVVNIGMNLGLMPITGIPLPFVSSGGSSLITFLIGLGLVQSIIVHHKRLDFQ
jgi:rod shape determining protein RodA